LLLIIAFKHYVLRSSSIYGCATNSLCNTVLQSNQSQQIDGLKVASNNPKSR